MNDPDSQKNMILAIVLSLAVLLGWQYMFVWPKEQERRRQAQAQQTIVPGTQANGTTGATPPVSASGSLPTAAALPTMQNALSRPTALGLSPRVAIDTPSLTGSIALKGGRVDDLVLAKYRDTTELNSANVVLLDPPGVKDSYFAEFGWVPAAGQTVTVPKSDSLWTQQNSGALTPSTPVILTFDNGQGELFRRTISVDDRYMFTVKDEVENKSSSPIALQPYGRIYRVGTPKTSGFAVLHEGLIGVLSPDTAVGLQEVNYSDLTKEATTREKEKKVSDRRENFFCDQRRLVGFHRQILGHGSRAAAKCDLRCSLDGLQSGRWRTGGSISSRLLARTHYDRSGGCASF